MSKQQNKQEEIPLEQLTPKQLLQVKKSIEEEIQQLNQSMNQFKVAIGKYEESKTILNSLKASEQGQELLVPITSSLFVPGQIEDNNKVLIDFGTGYFVERNLEQGQGVCDRKLALLKKNAQTVSEVVAQKANFLDKVNLEIQRKMAQYQKEMAAQNQQQ